MPVNPEHVQLASAVLQVASSIMFFVSLILMVVMPKYQPVFWAFPLMWVVIGQEAGGFDGSIGFVFWCFTAVILLTCQFLFFVTELMKIKTAKMRQRIREQIKKNNDCLNSDRMLREYAGKESWAEILQRREFLEHCRKG